MTLLQEKNEPLKRHRRAAWFCKLTRLLLLLLLEWFVNFCRPSKSYGNIWSDWRLSQTIIFGSWLLSSPEATGSRQWVTPSRWRHLRQQWRHSSVVNQPIYSTWDINLTQPDLWCRRSDFISLAEMSFIRTNVIYLFHMVSMTTSVKKNKCPVTLMIGSLSAFFYANYGAWHIFRISIAVNHCLAMYSPIYR